ncbi:hypothetical protein BMB17_005397, partial [Escherichia coli]|nr:hypothetical protein [Escherichia coli]
VTARRKVLYEVLFPETANGANQHTRVRNNCEGSEPERFTKATADATGRSEREEQRAEWIELVDKKNGELLSQLGKAVLSDGRRAGPQHQKSGINAASRELGISRIAGTSLNKGVEMDATSSPLWYLPPTRGDAFRRTCLGGVRRGG